MPASGIHCATDLTPDPLGIAGTMTLYDYAAGNPMNYLDTDAAQPTPEPSLQLLDKLSKWKDAVELTCQAGNHAHNEYRDAQLESLRQVVGNNNKRMRAGTDVARENCDRSFALLALPPSRT